MPQLENGTTTQLYVITWYVNFVTRRFVKLCYKYRRFKKKKTDRWSHRVNIPISDELLNLPLNTSEMHVWLKCKLLDHVTAKRHQNAQIWSFLNLKERKTVNEQLLHCFVSSKCFRFQFSGPNSLNYSNWLVKLVKLTKIDWSVSAVSVSGSEKVLEWSSTRWNSSQILLQGST